MSHAHSLEWWSEVDLIGLSSRTIGVTSDLIPSSDVPHHSYKKKTERWSQFRLEENSEESGYKFSPGLLSPSTAIYRSISKAVGVDRMEREGETE